MAQDQIRYDVLVQEALRGVVRKVLGEVARTGLPGEHHFFISFDTRAPGVRISTALRERHPEEMTIVIQHQYWDLQVTEQAFEVALSFRGVAERLHIPFTAVKRLDDPSVGFALAFHVDRDESAEVDGELESDSISAVPPPEANKSPAKSAGSPVTKAKPEPATEKPGEPAPGEGASVVSLDKFRKKP